MVASETTILQVDRRLPPGVTIKDLGKFRLKDLYNPESIFQLDIEGLQRDFLPLRTLDVIPNNLPDQMTPFIGRRAEIAGAIKLLEKVRLLTLTGPGGTGKTRLALQIAAEVSHLYPDGAFFVGLSPVSDVDVVPSVILGCWASPRPETKAQKKASWPSWEINVCFWFSTASSTSCEPRIWSPRWCGWRPGRNSLSRPVLLCGLWVNRNCLCRHWTGRRDGLSSLLWRRRASNFCWTGHNRSAPISRSMRRTRNMSSS